MRRQIIFVFRRQRARFRAQWSRFPQRHHYAPSNSIRKSRANACVCSRCLQHSALRSNHRDWARGIYGTRSSRLRASCYYSTSPLRRLLLVWPPPRATTNLAFEVLVRGDQAKGRVCVIPLNLFLDCTEASGIAANCCQRNIARKANKRCGRLVIDASRAGLNCALKKKELATKWGPIRYPDLSAHYCDLFLGAERAFPGEPIHSHKVDKEVWYRRQGSHKRCRA